MIKGKNIIVGVTGSIAAYKSAILIRLLIKSGASVRVLMTDLAKEFISPLTLATLSKNPVLVDFYNPENGDWNNHVELGIWADAFIIAPATANTIGKMANGIADNLLLTTYLSARCPVFISPAMDLDMYQHETTQTNLDKLKKHGNLVIDPQTGDLASGLEGKGRMQEPEQIVEILERYFGKPIQEKQIEQRFVGRKILVTAGPTYEPIDPVRFVGNYSSGKMGYAVAERLADEGANVILVTGPTSLDLRNESILRINVITAEEMFKSCRKYFTDCDIGILTAAVADYKPKEIQEDKIKKESDEMSIDLVATEDIASELGKIKKENQILVGFALETRDEKKNAQDKLKKKNLDFIVLNSLKDKGAGFLQDTNKITIIDKDNKIEDFKLKSKSEVAIDIVNKIYETI